MDDLRSILGDFSVSLANQHAQGPSLALVAAVTWCPLFSLRPNGGLLTRRPWWILERWLLLGDAGGPPVLGATQVYSSAFLLTQSTMRVDNGIGQGLVIVRWCRFTCESHARPSIVARDNHAWCNVFLLEGIVVKTRGHFQVKTKESLLTQLAAACWHYYAIEASLWCPWDGGTRVGLEEWWNLICFIMQWDCCGLCQCGIYMTKIEARLKNEHKTNLKVVFLNFSQYFFLFVVLSWRLWV